ncbi:MAG: hypothetical protein RQ760_03530 [Sedimentisphaerales bacterium]|nr:hypothetical protein [Sedimentisphaerales bacterium]
MKDVHKTTAGKVSVPVLPRFLKILLKFAKCKYLQIEGVDPALASKCGDKSAMTVKSEKNIIAGLSISNFMFLGCLS